MGQILCFAAPMIGNYGAGPGHDESDRAWPAAVVMAPRRRRGPGAGGPSGWRTWLRERGRGGRRRLRHPAAGAPAARPRRDARGVSAPSSAPRSCSRACARTRCSTGATWPPRRAGPRAGSLGGGRPAGGGHRLRHEGEHRRRPGRGRLPPRGGPGRDQRRARCWRCDPDGVFVSNGPGDPAAVTPVIDARGRAARARCRCFGICLGHQLLGARARPAHRASCPSATAAPTTRCAAPSDGGVEITVQNHGYAVVADDPARRRARSRARASSTARWRASPRPSCAPGRCSTTPRRAPGRATRATCSASSSAPSAGPADAAPRRPPHDPGPRQRPDRDRPGRRVRLLGHPGAPRALREEGYRVVLVNSNPATIMTDPVGGRPHLRRAARRRRPSRRSSPSSGPDALLPTLGRPDGAQPGDGPAPPPGVLERHGVELIGADVAAIRRAEDREAFRDTMAAAGLAVPDEPRGDRPGAGRGRRARARPARSSCARASRWAARAAAAAHTPEELERAPGAGARREPDRAGAGGALGARVGRDRAGGDARRGRQRGRVCSIENIDPMGVHTGDSVTVAPVMTLTDPELQRLRDAAIAVIRAVGVATGGANVQFALNRATRRDGGHRDEPARLAQLGAGLEGDRLPDRQDRGPPGRGLHARRAAQRDHRGHARPASSPPSTTWRSRCPASPSRSCRAPTPS